MPASSEVTRLLLELSPGGLGDSPASEQLAAAVYPDLRRLARILMRRERHFLGIAARAMHQILVDHARARAAAKHGGGWRRVTLNTDAGNAAAGVVELAALDDALRHFAAVDPRAAVGVELRVFGGLTVAEIAHLQGVSRRTVEADWAMARRRLARDLAGGPFE